MANEQRKMTRIFSDQEIERWRDGNLEHLDILLRTVRRGDHRRGRQFVQLSRVHESLGLAAIAGEEYGKALGHFGAAAGAWAYLLERYVAGEEIDQDLIEHLSSKPFNLALAANGEGEIERLTQLYDAAFPDARTGSNDFHWTGAVISLLANGKVELASEWAANPHPKVPPTGIRYLNALIEGDEDGIREHCRFMAGEWKDTILTEGLKRLPDAVCDHAEIGSIRLFERLWGHRPDVDLAAAKIPPEIFDAVAEPVDGTL